MSAELPLTAGADGAHGRHRVVLERCLGQPKRGDKNRLVHLLETAAGICWAPRGVLWFCACCATAVPGAAACQAASGPLQPLPRAQLAAGAEPCGQHQRVPDTAHPPSPALSAGAAGAWRWPRGLSLEIILLCLGSPLSPGPPAAAQGSGRAASKPPYLPQHGGAVWPPRLETNTSPWPGEQRPGGCLAPRSVRQTRGVC